MNTEAIRTWLFSLDQADLHKVAFDHGIDPLNFKDDDDGAELIEAIIAKMEE